MKRSGGRPLRIAHAYGNRRDTITAATAADIDYIEADLWQRGGEFWVRHERRLGPLPILFDRKPRGVNRLGPWALTVFPGYYVRPDFNPIRLKELMDLTRGKSRILLDVKDPSGEGDREYAERLVRALAEADFESSAIVCGQTDVLDSVRAANPRLDVRHSIERQPQWEAFLRRVEADPGLRGVCMAHEFLTDSVAHTLEEKGLEVFCWTVDDPDPARALVERGVDGIISNRLDLLEGLRSV